MRKSIIVGVIFAAILFLGLISYFSVTSSTQNEIALSSIILTMISIIATWVVSHLYAKKTRLEEIENLNAAHEKSLKMYALKAAEKVMNLSLQLDRLNQYLLAYTEAPDDSDLVVVLRTRDERVTGAIHMVELLRSVNDTALSDWEGVIGEELDEKREKEEEKALQREKHVEELLGKVDSILEEVSQDGKANRLSAQIVQEELYDIKHEIFTALIGRDYSKIASVPPVRELGRRQKKTNIDCLQCKAPIPVKLKRNGEAIVRGVKCKVCGSKYVTYTDEEFKPNIKPRERLDEVIECPQCYNSIGISLENVPGASQDDNCSSCGVRLRFIRSAKGVNTKVVNEIHSQPKEAVVVDAEFIEKVRGELPDQPWPKGTHREVASKLGVPNSRVQKAISILIRQGVFKHQVDGKLYNIVELEMLEGSATN